MAHYLSYVISSCLNFESLSSVSVQHKLAYCCSHRLVRVKFRSPWVLGTT